MIAPVLSLSGLCGGKELRHAATHSDVDLAPFDKFCGDAVDIVRINWMRVKRRAGRRSEFSIRYQAGGPSVFTRQFNDVRDWFSVGIDRNGTISHSHSGRNRSCGGGLVRSSEIF